MASSAFDKGLAVAVAIAPLAAGATTAWISGKYADASARRETNVRMVELAVGILQQAPSPETRSLRTWATVMVDKYSDVRLGEPARLALRDSVRLPRGVFGVFMLDSVLWIGPKCGTPLMNR